MQQQGQGYTGTPNEYYDLVSIIYHALQGAQTCQMYIRDAEQRGDQELAQFFRQVQQEDKRRSDWAKQLLVNRLSQAGIGQPGYAQAAPGQGSHGQTGMSGSQSTTR